MNWKPIETAPKDGNPIIVWDSADKEPVVASWHSGSWFVHNSYGFNEDGRIPTVDITHWCEWTAPE